MAQIIMGHGVSGHFGNPGAVSRTAVATRERLRAYHDRALDLSARRGMRGWAPVLTRS